MRPFKRQIEWCFALVIHCIDVGSGIDEDIDRQRSPGNLFMKRGPSAVRSRVWICALLQQKADHALAALVHRQSVERRLSLGVARIDVRAMHEKKKGDVLVSSYVKRRCALIIPDIDVRTARQQDLCQFLRIRDMKRRVAAPISIMWRCAMLEQSFDECVVAMFRCFMKRGTAEFVYGADVGAERENNLRNVSFLGTVQGRISQFIARVDVSAFSDEKCDDVPSPDPQKLLHMECRPSELASGMEVGAACNQRTRDLERVAAIEGRQSVVVARVDICAMRNKGIDGVSASRVKKRSLCGDVTCLDVGPARQQQIDQSSVACFRGRV